MGHNFVLGKRIVSLGGTKNVLHVLHCILFGVVLLAVQLSCEKNGHLIRRIVQFCMPESRIQMFLTVKICCSDIHTQFVLLLCCYDRDDRK